MFNKITVLIIEDEEAISNFISATLTANQYHTIVANTGQEAMSLAQSYCPEVILLDLGLPDIDGVELIAKIRAWSGVPIVVVSARDTEQEKVKALDYGADDYITKPFGTSELLARIRTAIRHNSSLYNNSNQPIKKYVVGGLLIDFEKRLITVSNQMTHLTKVEYKIVALLAKHAGCVMTYDSIINEIWGPLAGSDNRILRVNMANIRRKIEKNPAEPEYIFTEIGVGYRMAESEFEIKEF